MGNKVVLLPSFQEKLRKRKYRDHLKMIHRLIKKLEKLGKNTLKILDVQDHYLLCEMKVMKPPYRLYVIADQRNNSYYVVKWEHKKKQEKIINELKKKLSLSINFVLDKMFI